MVKDPNRPIELTEHLTELRTRLMRSIVYLVIGAIAAWFLYDWLFSVLTLPMQDVLHKLNSKFLLTGFPEAFTIRVQICLVAGLIVASPFLIIEIWGFIAPGLTREEKRPLYWIMPLSVLLFACGVALCYTILPVGFKWFVKFVPKNAELRPAVQSSIIFILKMLLAFGIVFELPVFLMFFAKVGIVDSKLLRDNWRYAVVATAVVAAFATPSNDALSMLMMAVPLVILYFLSILLVRLIEGKSRK